MSAVTSQCNAQVSQRANKKCYAFQGRFRCETPYLCSAVGWIISGMTTSGTAVLPNSVYLSLSDC